MNYIKDIDISSYEGINKLKIEDNNYPIKLRQIHNPPKVLYYKGTLPDWNMPMVAIIGARMCSPYGSYIAECLGRKLAESGIGIISGMAKGIDGISQQFALENDGYSIGVLGSGVDVCYPRTNKNVYNMLCEKGCVLSEYIPGTNPNFALFPARNRIISGLCDALIVVEAKEKSGTLITTDYALEQGKDIYIVPGRITDNTSKGCLSLIKQGAEIITDINDFIKQFIENYFNVYSRIYTKKLANKVSEESFKENNSNSNYNNLITNDSQQSESCNTININQSINKYQNSFSICNSSSKSKQKTINVSKDSFKDSVKDTSILSKSENKLYKTLEYRPYTINELAQMTNIEINKIKNDIISLELLGFSREISKGYYVKA